MLNSSYIITHIICVLILLHEGQCPKFFAVCLTSIIISSTRFNYLLWFIYLFICHYWFELFFDLVVVKRHRLVEAQNRTRWLRCRWCWRLFQDPTALLWWGDVLTCNNKKVTPVLIRVLPNRLNWF